MRGFALLLLVGVLSGSTSGTFELLVPEPCAFGETSSSPDEGHCGPTCVRCGCCARPLQVTPEHVEARSFASWRDLPFIAPFVPLASPSDILHVPRPFPA